MFQVTLLHAVKTEVDLHTALNKQQLDNGVNQRLAAK